MQGVRACIWLHILYFGTRSVCKELGLVYGSVLGKYDWS